MAGPVSEGNLKAPTRHPLDWQNPDFYDEASLHKEMERVFEVCHGCRRCVSLCHCFPTLFDLVNSSESMEVDGVEKEDYWKVVQHCFLCDLCYMTKCPYVPPHPWNLDFPHLMLRAKAVRYKTKGASLRDRALINTDALGAPLANPVCSAGGQPHQFDRRGAESAPRGRGRRREGLDSEIRRAHVCASGWKSCRTRRKASRPAERPAKSRCSPPATPTATSRGRARTSPRCSSTTAFR